MGSRCSGAGCSEFTPGPFCPWSRVKSIKDHRGRGQLVSALGDVTPTSERLSPTKLGSGGIKGLIGKSRRGLLEQDISIVTGGEHGLGPVPRCSCPTRAAA